MEARLSSAPRFIGTNEEKWAFRLFCQSCGLDQDSTAECCEACGCEQLKKLKCRKITTKERGVSLHGWGCRSTKLTSRWEFESWLGPTGERTICGCY